MNSLTREIETRDLSTDVFRVGQQPLKTLMAPKTVAVIGATEKPGSVGRTILWNLIQTSFGGTVYPVNPTRHSVLGIKSYPSIGDVPEKVDLAVIVTPAPTVPDIIRQCVAAGVKNALVISAGFKEIGAEGADLELRISEEARKGAIRVVGPNCLGVMVPPSGLNATFAGAMARAGSVGFISQSGAILTSILDWSFTENVGFSAVVSLGSMLDVSWGDMIDYLGDDPRTKSIVIYMESIGNARAFLSAAREVALTKPIIVIKAGKTEAAAKAASSHTGAMTGRDEVLDAAFRRAGVLRVNTIAEVFYMVEVLGKQPRPKGKRLAIITNAGGPGVLAVDSLISNGGELASLSSQTMESLNQFLPPPWSHGNPVDILGDADPARYAKAVEIVSKDPENDGVLVILTPQAMTDPAQSAVQLKPYARLPDKPILASWMGTSQVQTGQNHLNRYGIPTFPYPDTAARIFTYMWRYSFNLLSIYETPILPRETPRNIPDRERARAILKKVDSEGRDTLTELESKSLLKCYGLPVVETRAARNSSEAVRIAEAMGYPVVLKVLSKTVTHKSDVGGVQLNLADKAAVRRAFDLIADSVRKKAGEGAFDGVTVQPMIRTSGQEIIFGSFTDPQFGPVLAFGCGGKLVEVFKDHALGLPPLNTTLARRMMERTKIYTVLKGFRGEKAADISFLESLLVRFSQLVIDQDRIREIDINPLIVSGDGVQALDARVILHRDPPREGFSRLAIRPYPSQYVKSWKPRNKRRILIRPIRPEDEPAMVEFHKGLSQETVYFRYLQNLQVDRRIAHERLSRICFIDYDREIVMVAERAVPEGAGKEIMGVGRLSKFHGREEAEFALLVADRFQKKGLGTELLRRLLDVARDEKLKKVVAVILAENRPMLSVAKKIGFKLHHEMGAPSVEAEIVL